jgi:hypothetical protein
MTDRDRAAETELADLRETLEESRKRATRAERSLEAVCTEASELARLGEARERELLAALEAAAAKAVSVFFFFFFFFFF